MCSQSVPCPVAVVAVQVVQVSFATPIPSSAHASGMDAGRTLSGRGGALVQSTTPGSPEAVGRAAGEVVGETARDLVAVAVGCCGEGETLGDAGADVTTAELVAGGAVGLVDAAADAGAVVRMLVAPAAVEVVEWPVPHATVLRASASRTQAPKPDVFVPMYPRTPAAAVPLNLDAWFRSLLCR